MKFAERREEVHGLPELTEAETSFRGRGLKGPRTT